MEGFDLLSTGAWSIIPPLLALGLALLTKEVYSSLLVGVFTGTIIYEFTLEGAGISQLISAFATIPQIMAAQIGGNGGLLLFLALLGALVMVIAAAGGSRAYGEWVSKHIKSKRMALVLTSVLGFIIFVDDYFNCLTVGAVMRPVTDRFKISREKLSWIIDSTAAPVCIIAPVSSWAVAVGGYLGDNGFSDFIASIPYNFYALLTIVFVLYMSFRTADYGPMKRAQLEYEAGIADEDADNTAASRRLSAMVDSDRDDAGNAEAAIEEFKRIEKSDRGTVADLLVPILVLIVFAILGMMYAGGFFTGEVDFGTAVGEDPVTGLCIGVLVALFVAAGMFLPRKLLTLQEFMESVAEGVRSMVGPIMILVLAWSLGGLCRYMLGTGEFVSGFLEGIGVSLSLLPVVIFIVSAFISFAMGTSWGTIALVLPIVVGIFPVDSPLYLVAVGSTLAGAVYGDHVSPISDTTILSSAGAQCNHIRHVTTQLPYASTVMVICILCYILASVLQSPWIPLALGVLLVLIAVPVLSKFWSPALKDKQAS